MLAAEVGAVPAALQSDCNAWWVTASFPSRANACHSTQMSLLGCLRAEGERGIALLKTRWKALNRIRLCPQRIGAITKAALVLTRAERPIR